MQSTTSQQPTTTTAPTTTDEKRVAEIVVSLRRILALNPSDAFITYEASKALQAAESLSTPAC
jgi:hypothetical protein